MNAKIISRVPANIEIAEEVGEGNIWLFGTLTPEVEEIRYEQLYNTLLFPLIITNCNLYLKISSNYTRS